jgi:hypothetical protein
MSTRSNAHTFKPKTHFRYCCQGHVTVLANAVWEFHLWRLACYKNVLGTRPRSLTLALKAGVVSNAYSYKKSPFAASSFATCLSSGFAFHPQCKPGFSPNRFRSLIAIQLQSIIAAQHRDVEGTVISSWRPGWRRSGAALPPRRLPVVALHLG